MKEKKKEKIFCSSLKQQVWTTKRLARKVSRDLRKDARKNETKPRNDVRKLFLYPHGCCSWAEGNF